MVEWGLEGGVIDWKAIIWTKLTSRTHLVHIVHLVCQVHLVQNKRWIFSREPERGGGGVLHLMGVWQGGAEDWISVNATTAQRLQQRCFLGAKRSKVPCFLTNNKRSVGNGSMVR